MVYYIPVAKLGSTVRAIFSFIFKQLEMTICDRVKTLSKFFSTWAGKITWFDFFEIYPDPALSLGTPFEGNIFSWKGGRESPINL